MSYYTTIRVCQDCGANVSDSPHYYVRCRNCFRAHLLGEQARQDSEREAAAAELVNLKTANAYLRSRIDLLADEICKLKASGAAARAAALPADRIAGLLQLYRPDRHGNSPASNEATC